MFVTEVFLRSCQKVYFDEQEYDTSKAAISNNQAKPKHLNLRQRRTSCIKVVVKISNLNE